MVHMVPANTPSVGSAAIRALHSLNRRDADAVRATVRAAARGHVVEEHDDYDGYLSLLISPADENGAAFLVAGRTGAVDVAELRGDEMIALGTFPSTGAAMAVLRPALGRSVEPTASPVADAAALIARHGTDAAVQAGMRADAQPEGRRWTAVLQVIEQLDGPS